MSGLRILSLGWGVQSWTLAAMAALGDIEPIDFAVHADTRHEKGGTYDHAAAMTPWLEARGVKVQTVYAENTDLYRGDWGAGAVMIPVFSENEDGTAGQVRRQCTQDWKISPIRRFVAEELKRRGLTKRAGVVESVQGISYDEWMRMRDSDVAYIKNVYPLVDLKMTRAHCTTYLSAHDLPVPPKSSCVFCPYHTREEWRGLKRAGGDDWAQVLAAEVEIDEVALTRRRPTRFFLHGLRRPIADAVTIPEDVGAAQMAFDALCDGGFCGV